MKRSIKKVKKIIVSLKAMQWEKGWNVGWQYTQLQPEFPEIDDVISGREVMETFRQGSESFKEGYNAGRLAAQRSFVGEGDDSINPHYKKNVFAASKRQLQ